MARFLNRLILAIARHWLALANGVIALVLGLAVLAPCLMLSGYADAGQLLYTVFKPLCHQLPERSFFIGGPKAAYGLAELSAHLGYEAPLRWIGDAQLGYKVAFCERDTAIYAGWLLAGLAFGLARRRRRVAKRSGGQFPNRPYRGLSWQGLVLTMLPMAVDGTGQLLGAWESTWWLRAITGLLFAVGTVWFAFPWMEQGMADAQGIAEGILEGTDATSR